MSIEIHTLERKIISRKHIFTKFKQFGEIIFRAGVKNDLEHIGLAV